MISRRAAGRAVIAVGVLGLVAGLVGTVIGRRLVMETGLSLDRSLALSAETLSALESSVAAADETVSSVQDGLVGAETTARSLSVTAAEGAEVLDGAADLTEHRIAASVEAVRDSLPPVISVAAVIDRTLSGLDRLPVGPEYRPEQPFDDSLRELERSLDGAPDDLREQALLMRQLNGTLDEVGEGAAALAGDARTIREGLTATSELLDRYAVAAASAAELVAEAGNRLALQIRLARLLVTLLGLIVVAAQVIPLTLGWALLRPPGSPGLLREP